MDIGVVMDELAAAVGVIDELRVHPYTANRVTPPACVVGWPEEYTFDRTYGRGSDQAQFPITVIVGKLDARSSRDRLAQYADGSGPSSIKQAVESYSSAAWHSVRVQSAEFEVITVADVQYLGATFQVDVYAQGS